MQPMGSKSSSPGPDAEVQITVMYPTHPGGPYSLTIHPQASGATKIHFTPQGVAETAGLARQVKWIPVGLTPGQHMIILEKAGSASKGHFTLMPTISYAQQYRLSGRALRGPVTPDPEVCWSYEVILTDGTQVLARLDPEIIISPDP